MERKPPVELSIFAYCKDYKVPFSPQFILDPKPTGKPQDTYGTGSYTYHTGDEVTITAPKEIPIVVTPRVSTVCIFDHWGGDAKGDSPKITITMDSDKHIVAVYTYREPPEYYPGPPTPPGELR